MERASDGASERVSVPEAAPADDARTKDEKYICRFYNSAREWPGASSRFASGGPSRPGRPFVSSASLLLAREGCMALRLAPLTLASSLRVGPARRACCFTKGGRPLRGHRPVLMVCCAEYERRRRLAGCLVACWGVSVRVFLWAGGWGGVHQGLKHDERTESSLFSPLG